MPERERKGGGDIRERKRKQGREAEKDVDRRNRGKEKDLSVAPGYKDPVNAVRSMDTMICLLGM